jgi:hypothetical protein
MKQRELGRLKDVRERGGWRRNGEIRWAGIFVIQAERALTQWYISVRTWQAKYNVHVPGYTLQEPVENPG